VREPVFAEPPVAVGRLVAVVDLEPVHAPVPELHGHDVEVLKDDRLVDVRAVSPRASRSAPGVPSVGHSPPAVAPRPGHDAEVGCDALGVALKTCEGVRLARVNVVQLGIELPARLDGARLGQIGRLRREEGEAAPAVRRHDRRIREGGDVEHGDRQVEGQPSRDPCAVPVQVDDGVVPARRRLASEAPGDRPRQKVVAGHVARHDLDHVVEDGQGAVVENAVARGIPAEKEGSPVIAVHAQRADLGHLHGLPGCVVDGDAQRVEAPLGVCRDAPDHVGLAADPVHGYQKALCFAQRVRLLPPLNRSLAIGVGRKLRSVGLEALQRHHRHGADDDRVPLLVDDIDPPARMVDKPSPLDLEGDRFFRLRAARHEHGRKRTPEQPHRAPGETGGPTASRLMSSGFHHRNSPPGASGRQRRTPGRGRPEH
jgi:hypothetical protein